jgi:hypothetical protein
VLHLAGTRLEVEGVAATYQINCEIALCSRPTCSSQILQDPSARQVASRDTWSVDQTPSRFQKLQQDACLAPTFGGGHATAGGQCSVAADQPRAHRHASLQVRED